VNLPEQGRIYGLVRETVHCCIVSRRAAAENGIIIVLDDPLATSIFDRADEEIRAAGGIFGAERRRLAAECEKVCAGSQPAPFSRVDVFGIEELGAMKEEAEIGSCQPRAQRFRRRRRAFPAARLSHGAAAAFVPRPVIIAIVDCCNAAAFSVTIRRYSAGVQLPRAIIELRRAIVSHEAAINSTIINGRGGRRRRASLFILRQLAGGRDSVKMRPISGYKNRRRPPSPERRRVGAGRFVAVPTGSTKKMKRSLCGTLQSSSILLDKGQQRVPVGLQRAPTPAASIEHADPGRGGLDVELAIAQTRDDRSSELCDKPLKAAGTVRTAA